MTKRERHCAPWIAADWWHMSGQLVIVIVIHILYEIGEVDDVRAEAQAALAIARTTQARKPKLSQAAKEGAAIDSKTGQVTPKAGRLNRQLFTGSIGIFLKYP